MSSYETDSRLQGRMRGQKKNIKGMEDVFAPAPLTMTSLGTGPGVITPVDKPGGYIN